MTRVSTTSARDYLIIKQWSPLNVEEEIPSSREMARMSPGS